MALGTLPDMKSVQAGMVVDRAGKEQDHACNFIVVACLRLEDLNLGRISVPKASDHSFALDAPPKLLTSRNETAIQQTAEGHKSPQYGL